MGRRQPGAVAGVTRQCVRIGPAGERVGGPGRGGHRPQPGAPGGPHQRRQLLDGEGGEGALPLRLQLAGVTAAEEHLDHRPAEGAQVVAAGLGAVDPAEQVAVRRQLVHAVPDQLQLVGQAERQARGGFGLVRQARPEFDGAPGDQVGGQGEDHRPRGEASQRRVQPDPRAGMVDQRHRRLERHRGRPAERLDPKRLD